MTEPRCPHCSMPSSDGLYHHLSCPRWIPPYIREAIRTVLEYRHLVPAEVLEELRRTER